MQVAKEVQVKAYTLADGNIDMEALFWAMFPSVFIPDRSTLTVYLESFGKVFDPAAAKAACINAAALFDKPPNMAGSGEEFGKSQALADMIRGPSGYMVTDALQDTFKTWAEGLIAGAEIRMSNKITDLKAVLDTKDNKGRQAIELKAGSTHILVHADGFYFNGEKRDDPFGVYDAFVSFLEESGHIDPEKVFADATKTEDDEDEE